MSAISVQTPFPIFNDIDGQPLEAGYIFVGVANLDPQGNPVAVFFDEALTQPAGQPIRTMGGYAVNSGTPTNLYSGSDYSIRVTNKNGLVIYSAPVAQSYLTLPSPSGSSSVGFIQAGAGAVANTVQGKLRESVSVMDFGAVGNGVTDDTTAIRNAIASGAKRITGVAGSRYIITDTITINVPNIEIDFNGAELVLNNPSGTLSHLFLGDGVTQCNGIRLKNIVFTRVQIATAGYAIDSDFIGVCEINNCRIFGNNLIFNGIRILRGIIIKIQGNYVDNCRNFGLYLEGTNTTTFRTVDVIIRENRIEGGVTALSTWDFVEGVFCRDNIFFNTSGAVVTVNASSPATGLVSFKFQQNDFDSGLSTGLFINNVDNVQITGNWFSNLASHGIDMDATDSVIVLDNQLYVSGDGIRVAGRATVVSGNLVSGGGSALYVRATARHTTATGNQFSNCNIGVNLAEGCTDVSLQGNTIFGVSSNSVAGEIPGTRIYITDNKGDVAIGASNYLSVGASPFTYVAGPRPEFINMFSGTVSQVAFGGNAFAFSSPNSFSLSPGQSVTVTYSVLPIMLRKFG